MPELNEDRAEKNRQIVASLRETFLPLTERLTPDVEPATMYLPARQEPDDEE